MSIPGSLTPLFNSGSSAAAGGYQVSRSLRFNSSDSAYCGRVFSTNGTDRKRLTLSYWIKLCDTSAARTVISGYNGSSTEAAYWQFNSGGAFSMSLGGASSFGITTTQVFRDPSAWYHFVISIDTTIASPSSDRIKLYVNGTQVTAFSSTTYPTQNYEVNLLNAGTQTNIGVAWNTGYGGYMNGYLADVHFIDGQALTPSSFTEVSATTGQLIPKAYTGTFGTNGFWLKFSDNSAATAAALGNDYSGNNNDWTPNNLSVTAGSGNDSLVDTPTSYGTDTGVGGEVRGNYATLNPLKYGGDIQAPTNGNLDVTSVGSATGKILGTIGVSSGKWYWECVPNSSANIAFGITKDDTVLANYPGQDAVDYAYHNDGSKYSNNSGSAYGATYTTNDVIGVAFDADNGTLTFYKNNSSQGQAYSGLTSGPYFPLVGDPSSTPDISATVNFGQRAFAYTAPSGFKALCDTNLGAPLIAKPNTLMDVVKYDGNGSTQSITGLAFSPDLVWIKSRSSAYDNLLFDTVRTATKQLISNSTGAEATYANSLTAFNSNGFSVGSDAVINNNASTYVAWAWDAGTSTVSNTSGSITSQVRANASAGFSVVTYTGTGATTTQTIGHGLNVSLGMVIVKARDSGSNDMGWGVSHTSVAATNYLYLNTTNAASNHGPAQGQPSIGSGSTFSILAGTAPGTNNFNANGIRYVAYCFSSVVGYSSMGSYVGNGSSDGPFVFTGMRPRWILLKASSATGAWILHDTARTTYNVMGNELRPDDSTAEYAVDRFDLLSNGFKVRSSNATLNTSSATYIYIAFAENPFQYARAR